MNPTKILVSGEGGQGIQTIAKILSEAAYQSGYEVSYMPHYGVEMRMGISLAYLQIGKEKISYPKFDRADILVVLGKRDLEIPKSFIDIHSTIVNCINFNSFLQARNLPAKSLNMLCLGIISKELENKNIQLDQKSLPQAVNQYLSNKADLELNWQALQIGQSLEKELYKQPLDKIKSQQYQPVVSQDAKKEHWRFPNLCKSCGLCLERCPVQALFWSKEKINYIARPLPEVAIEKCIACGICEQICPDCAIKIIKK